MLTTKQDRRLADIRVKRKEVKDGSHKAEVGPVSISSLSSALWLWAVRPISAFSLLKRRGNFVWCLVPWCEWKMANRSNLVFVQTRPGLAR